MNALRRTLLVIYSLLLIAAAGGVIGLAWNQDRKLDLSMGDLNMQAFITSSDGGKLALTAVCALLALLGLFTLIVAVMRPTQAKSTGTLRLRQADGGTVEVTASAVESLLREELETYPEVRRLDPRVRLNNGAVETYLDAVIEPGSTIATVTSVLGQGVAQVLRDQVGVTNVRRPNIKISYDESGTSRPAMDPARRNEGTRSIMREEMPPATPPPMRPATAYGPESAPPAERDEDAPTHE